MKRPSPGRSPKNRTWEHPRGSGIRVAEIPNTTAGSIYGTSFQIRVPAKLTGGRRELHQRKTRRDAERLAEERLLAVKKHGTDIASMPPDALRQAATAWGLLQEHNKSKGATLGLVEVVRAGIQSLNPTGGIRTLAEVLKELRESKAERCKMGQLGHATNHDFAIRSARIEEDLGEYVMSDLTHTVVAEWLEKMAKGGAQFGGPLSARSVRNYRNILSEAFRFALARQYCATNPFDRFTKEDLKRHGGLNAAGTTGDINKLSVDEARRLLAAAAQEPNENGMLASVVLRLFCGFRTTEVVRLDWSEIHWQDPKPFVHLPASKAKKRRVRNVEIPVNAVAWLRMCKPPTTGSVVPGTGESTKDAKNYCTRFRRIARAAKIGKESETDGWRSEWENNDTRHAFGSYHYALHGDALLTAAQMGHEQGDTVLFAHYRALATKEEGQAYFDIKPPKTPAPESTSSGRT